MPSSLHLVPLNFMGTGSTQALIDRWQQVLARRGGDVAVWQCGGGAVERTSFAQLDHLADQVAAGLTGQDSAVPVAVRCSGTTLDFVATVLAAWKLGRAVLLLEEHDSEGAMPGPFADELAVVLVKKTSGSTGHPRHLLFNAEQVQADVDQLIPTMGLRADWINLAAVSPSHSYGFSNLITPLLLHGMPLLAPGSVLPAVVRSAIDFMWLESDRQSRLMIPAVPAMWRAWIEGGSIDRERLACAISAGAPLPPALERRAFDLYGLKIHNFYGSSESGGIAYDRSATPRESSEAVGSAVEGVRLEVDADGRVVVSSRACSLGVWEGDRLDPGSGVGNGRFETTDLGRLDPDGTLTLTGRADDLINLAGRKVHPESIELRLRALPGVAECLVFGIEAPDPARVHEMVACVRLRDDLQGSGPLNEIKRQLGCGIPSWQMPRHWQVMAGLKANARGKLSRHVWRQRYLDQQRASC